MAKEKKPPERDSSQDWLSTYSDMITLILTFFVLLYSMSTVDEQKWQYILQAFASKGNIMNPVVAPEQEPKPDFLNENTLVGDANGEAQTGNAGMPQDMQELYQYLKSMVEEEGLESSISVSQGKDQNIFIRFKDNTFFAPNSEILLSGGKVILDFIFDGLRGVTQDIAAIKINGHTADAQGGLSDLSDRRLSSGRADSVAIYLDGKEIIAPAKISCTGLGKHHPIAENDTEEGRSKNRRVEMVIMQNELDLSNPEALQQYLVANYAVDTDIDPEEIFTSSSSEEVDPDAPIEPPPPVDIVAELSNGDNSNAVVSSSIASSSSAVESSSIN